MPSNTRPSIVPVAPSARTKYDVDAILTVFIGTRTPKSALIDSNKVFVVLEVAFLSWNLRVDDIHCNGGSATAPVSSWIAPLWWKRSAKYIPHPVELGATNLTLDSAANCGGRIVLSKAFLKVK